MNREESSVMCMTAACLRLRINSRTLFPGPELVPPEFPEFTI